MVAAAEPNTELMKQNPQSRLPTLVLADGTVIYDLVVICEYLDTLHGGEKLFPAEWPSGWSRCAVMRSATACSTPC